MGGIEMRVDSGDGSHRVRRVYHEHLFELFENGTVEWPQIKESDIDHRTQGDKLVKAIALLQIIWFFAQIIGRAIEGLAVTTLELFTLGNVICAISTFLAWWNKPNGVRAPILIEGVAPSWVRCEDKTQLGAMGGQGKSALASLFIGFGFGAMHLAAWNFHFASTAERILWRISSIGVTVLSGIAPVTDFLNDYDTRKYPFLQRLRYFLDLYTCLGGTMKFIFNLSMFLYSLFRFYMFVEMFVALRDVPVDVYKTVQWSQYFPSLG
jgi:hypothetical protein